MALSRNSSTKSKWKYHVFLSFRGEDTRFGFADHLYEALHQKSIITFRDNDELKRGEVISKELLCAIEESLSAIVIISQNYASSTWCLDELQKVVETKNSLGQQVFPVFYGVDPSDVRRQGGSFAEDFIKHEEKFVENKGRVQKWRKALEDVACLAGWDARNRYETKLIEEIVAEVWRKVEPKLPTFNDGLVAIETKLDELYSCLRLGSEDVRFIGIWGMGGIGKTTHATVLYDKISYEFDACCFIENVSRIYRDGGAIVVQKQILHQTLGEINLEAYSPSEISRIVRHRLHNLKVLIVLDNVDQLEQLQELAIDPKLLHTGSRMIITTRNEHILRVYKADEIHKVALMNKNDAHNLFCKRAFESEEQSSKCMELIPEVLKYAQGLPLAIKVLGSSLCTRDAAQWEDMLDRLVNSPNKEIMDVLEISVKGLQYEDREILETHSMFL